MVVSARVTEAPSLTLDCKSTLEAPHGCLTSPEPQTIPDKSDPVPGGCEKMGEISWRPWTKYEWRPLFSAALNVSPLLAMKSQPSTHS